jgi:hypothetical protein
MQTKSAKFLITISSMLLASQSYADVLLCKHTTRNSIGTTESSLQVYKTEDGGYAYYASRCTQTGQHCIDDHPADYTSYGKLERFTYNGMRTSASSGNNVKIYSLFGQILQFSDKAESNNGAPVLLSFSANDCVFGDN